jgi:beta-lactamase superfamily II metal-dependent hydrolase
LKLTIFDTAHGFCAYIIADTHNVMLIDCGHDVENNFTPSVWLSNNGCTGIEQFIVCNYDEDHLADLQNVRGLGVAELLRNKSVTSAQLRKIKEKSGPISDAMKSMLEMMDHYTGGPVAPPIDFGGIETKVFYNQYPNFTDTNNLSLVLFLHYRNVHVAFTGDLAPEGWKELLKQEAFRKELDRTAVFIASHHGRTSGYNPDVFNYCKPYVVIVSDVEPEDKDESKVYEQHATGINWKGAKKKVLHTWDVGHIMIEQGATGNWTINSSK